MAIVVEKNGATTSHRLVVTYPLLQGQPSFVAEFTSWKTQPPFVRLRIHL
ncbi:DUF2092 domain-containing protein [Pararhizobium sp. A13]